MRGFEVLSDYGIKSYAFFLTFSYVVLQCGLGALKNHSFRLSGGDARIYLGVLKVRVRRCYVRLSGSFCRVVLQPVALIWLQPSTSRFTL